MDDVPVVISSKWKIPPLPNIPNECVSGFFDCSEVLKQQSLQYEYSLEQKVLEKVQEWKIARTREINEREMRIKLRQEERRKRLEAEGTKLKEQLTQVSYPSPDEFSDNEEETTKKTSEDKETQPFNNFDSILTPTVVNVQNSNEITSRDLEALSNVTMSKAPGSNVWVYNKNATKLELADFENDASDPFYNMELKTIDDLDILAQVLKTSVNLHSKVNKNSNCSNNNNNESDEKNSKILNGDDDETKENDEKPSDEEKSEKSPVKIDVTPEQQPDNVQNCYTSEPYVALPQYPNSGFTSFNPNIYSNYSQTPYYLPGTQQYNFGTDHHSFLPNTSYNSSPYAMDSLRSPPPFTTNSINDQNLSENASKLRSKSVPDIVKELEDELEDSQKRRIRNNSQCQEEERKNRRFDVNSTSNCLANTKNMEENQNCDELLIKKLPKELQNLALKISQMGFPIQRVCRIMQQVNGDDKKVRICDFCVQIFHFLHFSDRLLNI